MIDQFSISYPVRGAADAAGVPLTLAYPYVWANRLFEENPDSDTLTNLTNAWLAIVTTCGAATAVAFQERVEAAIMDGRVYWPVEGWFADRRAAQRGLPSIREDSSGELIVQPDPIP